MSEFNKNLWAPWRTEYIASLDSDMSEQSCFLCAYAASPADDEANHVVCRSERTLMVMNRYPYTNGHLLIAPVRHVPGMDELDDDELLELGRFKRDAMRLLAQAVHAQGYNTGMNFGRCAGAGLPGHLHGHIVPRWSGDTNFMFTVSDARVIPQSLDEVFGRLQEAARSIGLA